MVRDTEAVVAKASAALSDLAQIESELRLTARNVKNLSQSINAPNDGVPSLLRRADTTLATLHQTVGDLALAARRAPQITRNVELGTQDLPGLLTQTQETAHELEALTIQLRGVWFLGGGGKAPPRPTRLPTDEVRP
jgi:phospholipid/cholesterol/gamma-HCH transport system substrate-binding protein